MFDSTRKALRNIIVIVVLFSIFVFGYKFVIEYWTLRQIVKNLKAESRIAEVLVTQSSFSEKTGKYTTLIKFLEYDVHGKPLALQYFRFNGNLIQFQTLVVRFDDKFVEHGHRLKGKSIYLFLKAFVLDGKDTQEMTITKAHEVPKGYRVGDPPNYFERAIWKKFWSYALDPSQRAKVGIKNAQIEAPGSVFVPGTIYTLVLEHRGGIRIDTRPIPEILKNEKVI